MAEYDLVVMGAGNAGLGAARVASQAGWSVAVVEAREVGGVCPLRGCVPKKVLVAAAQALDTIRRADAHGIEVGEPTLDWPALMERKETFVEGVPDQIRSGLEAKGIDVYSGRAVFEGPHTVRVGEDRLGADQVLVATGSKPRSLPIDGSGHLITTDDLLELRERPDSLVFVGAGVVAMEFAHVFARAGTEVTLLEIASRPLPFLDEDAVAQVVEASERLGIAIHTEVQVQAVEADDDGYGVRYVQDGEEHVLQAACVANGAGRVAQIDDIGLEAAGITLEEGRVQLVCGLRSAEQPHVYFAGDAIPGAPQLSPVATWEGRQVGRMLVEEAEPSPDYEHMPSCVFTVPALAQVGKTEAAAREEGLSFTAKCQDMTGWRSARTQAEETAWAKILVEEGTGRILGAHLVGHGAQETIHLFAAAIREGWTADRIKETVYAYPTFHADVKYLV